MPVDPQFDQVLAVMGQFRISDFPLEQIRAAPPQPWSTEVDHVMDRTIPGPGGELGIRIYRSGGAGSLPVIFFMHGGGFVLGGLDSHDEVARVLTAQTRCVTVAVDYRLAPENPFPAAPDDCFAALQWVAAHAGELGADAGRIALAGDSAGGNLVAVLAHRARDRGGPALKGQVLIYPAVDLTAPVPPAPDGKYYVLTPPDCAFFHRSYAGAQEGHPDASPAFAKDFRGLPPALVITAEYDPLCSQGEAYAETLKEAGVDTLAVRYDGAIHGFVSMPVPMGRQALSQIADWLKHRFA